MDKPWEQVQTNGKQAYRYMSYPFQKQGLQELYPGRLMNNTMRYNGDNIPNEDPVGLDITREKTRLLGESQKMSENLIARRLGGQYPVVNHPAVEPEAIIDNPELRGVTLESTQGLSPFLEELPNVGLAPSKSSNQGFDESQIQFWRNFEKTEIPAEESRGVERYSLSDTFSENKNIESAIPKKDMIIGGYFILVFVIVFLVVVMKKKSKK